MIRRREWLAGAAAMAGAPRARAAGLRPVRLGIGLKAISPAVINLLIGEGLGSNAEERLTVRPMALGSNSNVQVATDRGDVDIGIGVPSFALPLIARGQYGDAVVSRRIKLYAPPYQGAKMGSIDPQELLTEAEMDRLPIRAAAKEYKA